MARRLATPGASDELQYPAAAKPIKVNEFMDTLDVAPKFSEQEVRRESVKPG